MTSFGVWHRPAVPTTARRTRYMLVSSEPHSPGLLLRANGLGYKSNRMNTEAAVNYAKVE